MADVSPPPVPGSDASRGGPRDSERGQLFLVGALALSVILVTLAVLLNTAIYTGNVATRDPGTGSADVIEYRAAANEMAGSTLTGVNYQDNESYAALKSNLNESVGNWTVAATRHSVVVGTDAYTKVLGTTKGTRIVQHGDRNFSNAAGDPSWELASGVLVRNFTITVDQSTLPTISNDATVAELEDGDEVTFSISVIDSNNNVWDVYVYEDPATGDVTVAVADPGEGLGKCSTTTPDPTIDLTNTSLAGEHCEALAFWSITNQKYTFRYSNADAANGNYSLIVDKDTTVLDKSDYNNDAGPSPYYTPALYSAKVSVTYRSPTVDYSTQFRVAPGEYDG